MTAQIFGQVLANGLLVGLLYALVAIGFSLMYGVCNIPFLAVGELYMLGGVFGVLFVSRLGIPYFLAVFMVMIVMGVMGVLTERFFRPLRGKELAFVVVSLGLAMAFANMALNIFGQRPMVVRSPVDGLIDFLGVNLPASKMVAVLACVVVVIALHLFNQRTKIGQGMRAISQDIDAAALQGIDINQSQAITFALGFIVSGLSGVLIAPIYYVDVFQGTPALMRALIIVVLGGLGSFPGAIAGGLLLGFVESCGYTFVGGVSHLISFAIVVVFLIVRPTGLLGRAQE